MFLDFNESRCFYERQKRLKLFPLLRDCVGFSFGICCIVRGSYWILFADKAQYESELYTAMHKVMPLTIWGIPFVLAGTLIILSGIKLPYHQTSISFYRLTAWGYAIACPFYYIFSTAGFDSGLNLVTPIMNLSFSIFCGATALLAYKNVSEMKQEKRK